MELANDKPANIDELLNELRDDLREELKLTKAPDKLYWLRIEKPKELSKQATRTKKLNDKSS